MPILPLITSLTNMEKKLSHFERWILIEAYREILKAGTDQPTKTTQKLAKVHLLRIDVVRDYFKLPIRERSRWHLRGNMVIDGAAVDPKRANAVRTALTRTLRLLKRRGLISGDITLTREGMMIAKDLYPAKVDHKHSP
jgi:hypothetical protein